MLINNPWGFEYCHDREEQRIDALFQDGSLANLQEINLDLCPFEIAVSRPKIRINVIISFRVRLATVKDHFVRKIINKTETALKLS